MMAKPLTVFVTSVVLAMARVMLVSLISGVLTVRPAGKALPEHADGECNVKIALKIEDD